MLQTQQLDPMLEMVGLVTLLYPETVVLVAQALVAVLVQALVVLVAVLAVVLVVLVAVLMRRWLGMTAPHRIYRRSLRFRCVQFACN